MVLSFRICFSLSENYVNLCFFSRRGGAHQSRRHNATNQRVEATDVAECVRTYVRARSCAFVRVRVCFRANGLCCGCGSARLFVRPRASALFVCLPLGGCGARRPAVAAQPPSTAAFFAVCSTFFQYGRGRFGFLLCLVVVVGVSSCLFVRRVSLLFVCSL